MADTELITKREVKEIYRKLIHISSLILPLSYRFVFNYDKKLTIYILFPLAILAVAVELIRLENKSIKRIFYKLFGIMLRKHEISDITGASYLLTSAVFCIALFPPDIAFAALSYLALGDTMAAIVGLRFGKRKILGSAKSLEGSLACFAVCLIYSIAFGLNPLMALIGSLTATFAELSALPVDDNIKIPVISCIVMSFASIFIT